MAQISNTLALGAGCYWGTEKFIVKDFQKQYPGAIKQAQVGFMAPDPNAMKNPSYRQVCSGQTGHVEVLHVELQDPAKTFEPLVRFFFQFHDPTTKDRQGNDAGSQYASVIFCADAQQKQIAESVKAELQAHVDAGHIPRYLQDTVETYIVDTNPFYPAHEEHQRYLEKNPRGYCNHYYRFKTWPAEPVEVKEAKPQDQEEPSGDIRDSKVHPASVKQPGFGKKLLSKIFQSRSNQ